MAVRKRRDTKKPSWQARWKNPDGVWQTKHFPTKAIALQFETQMKADVQQGEYSDPRSAKVKVFTVYANWQQANGHLKPKTVDAYQSLWKCLVGPAWGNKAIGSITRAEVRVWAQEAKSSSGRKVSVSRSRQAAVLLNLLLNHAVDMELIKRNPLGTLKGLVPKLEERKPKRALEVADLIRLADCCGQYREMVILTGLTGMRWAEIVALTREDFDFKDKTVRINKSLSEVNGNLYLVSTKSRKERVLPIPELILGELMELVLSTPESELIFRSKNGQFLRRGNFARSVFKPALVQAKLESVRFHDLRHTAITLQVSAGADILAISRIAGHSKPSTTLNVYAHELDGSTELIRNSIDELVREAACDKYATEEEPMTA